MNKPPIEKNEELELTIDSVTLEGAGVGRVDGFAVFVPGALTGERVRMHCIKVTSSYAIGGNAPHAPAAEGERGHRPVFTQNAAAAFSAT